METISLTAVLMISSTAVLGTISSTAVLGTIL
jgi:hypothetical protein